MSRRKGFLESHNPVMKESAYQQAAHEVLDGDMARTAGGIVERMTVQGAINKSLILGGIMLLTAVISFSMPSQLFLWGGAIGGLIVVVIASMKPQMSPTLAPVYAGLEGLFVGAISAVYASLFNGIIFQAVTLTMAVFFLMLFIYKAGIIKVTGKFRAGIIMATGAIRKKPAVVETEYGDLIAVRQLMFLSMSYDHRVVDGFLGGSFLRRVGDYLEAFDPNRSW